MAGVEERAQSSTGEAFRDRLVHLIAAHPDLNCRVPQGNRRVVGPYQGVEEVIVWLFCHETGTTTQATPVAHRNHRHVTGGDAPGAWAAQADKLSGARGEDRVADHRFTLIDHRAHGRELGHSRLRCSHNAQDSRGGACSRPFERGNLGGRVPSA